MANIVKTCRFIRRFSSSIHLYNANHLSVQKTALLKSGGFQRFVEDPFSLNCRRGICQRQTHSAAFCTRHKQPDAASTKENLLFTPMRYVSKSSCVRSEAKTPKIYTRTGDKGTSVTIAGDRRPKDDLVFEALGATDELSSHIGLAREYIRESNLSSCDLQLEEIQCVLQDAGSNIATPRSLAAPNQLKMTEFNAGTVGMLENWIDEMTASLPPLRNFILPSGGKASSALHVARSVCRRAERSIAPLARSEEIDPAVAQFINRLSDYLFTAARFVAQEGGGAETIYRRVKPRDRRVKPRDKK